ncbi:MAG: hypothetical protein ABMA14_13595 [Hyphomonadaceae bacterium]
MVDTPPPRRSAAIALTGAIPAIALSAGLLSLEPTSALRQEYWPWLPLVVLAIGMASSAVFWLVLAPRWGKRNRDS